MNFYPLQTNDGENLRLTLLQIDLDGTFPRPCDTDFLNVRRIEGGTKRFCGFTFTVPFVNASTNVFFTEAQELVIRFKTDATINSPGFYIRVQGKLKEEAFN